MEQLVEFLLEELGKQVGEWKRRSWTSHLKRELIAIRKDPQTQVLPRDIRKITHHHLKEDLVEEKVVVETVLKKIKINLRRNIIIQQVISNHKFSEKKESKALYNMRDLNFFIKNIERDLSEKFAKLNFNSMPTSIWTS